MEYRLLGRTGIKVSPLCLGCMNFGGRTAEDESIRIIHAALDAGINFVDTANVYSRGRSEEVTGKGLRDRRDGVVLATKVHGRMADDDPNMLGNSRRHIIQQCDASLKRLGTDWIDLYQIHRPDPSIPIDETLRALDDLVRAGKVRYIGTSTFAAWQIVESLWASKELGLNRFVSEQPPYHLLDRRWEREVIPMARTFGIGVIPWSPLAGGFLTGKYQRGSDRTEGERFAGKDDPRTQRLFSDASFDALEALQPLAEARRCTISQFALGWNLNQPGITSPIIGPRAMDQLEDNLAALDVEITDEDRGKIDAICPPGQAIVPWAEARWGPNEHRVMA